MFSPGLTQPYGQTDLKGIFVDTLRILEKVGVACAEPQTVERVTAQPGVRWENGRFFFEADATEEYVARVRALIGQTPEKEPAFELLAPWCCLNYHDPETGKVRPATTEDAIRMTRLMDARGYTFWPIPLVPRDVPAPHATLTAEYIALSHSRGLGGFMSVSSVKEIEFLIEMNVAVGRTFLLDEQIGISPLRLDDHGLKRALHFQGRNDVRVILVGAMPAFGSTTPLSVRAAVAQVAAESIALSVVCDRLGFGPGGFGGEIFPFDFQYAGIVFGGPEDMLLMSATHQFIEFLNGRPKRMGVFHSMAKAPDPQAASERTAGALWQALLGVRRFHGAGQLAVDEVFSPQQAVIDEEILSFVERVMRGIEPMEDVDVAGEIAAGISSGTFLDSDLTARGFREFSFWPRLFLRQSVGRWRMEGERSVLAQAWEIAKEQMARSDWRLPEEKARDLEKVYRRALKEVV